eukprot:scaffold92148_cov48-Phaeocystis_antarctica.AAC.3
MEPAGHVALTNPSGGGEGGGGEGGGEGGGGLGGGKGGGLGGGGEGGGEGQPRLFASRAKIRALPVHGVVRPEP